MKIIIDNVVIDNDSDCYVIAEIGHNHQGDINIAKKMIQTAKECGAQAVKLQKRDNRTLFTNEMYKSPYNNENSYGSTYGEHREALEFDKEDYIELKNYAREQNISLFATAFDFNSADLLQSIDMPAYKIASGDLTNIPLLKHIAGFGKPLIVSTGGAGLEDVRRAYDTIMPINDQLCILQCTAAYPIFDYRDMNLKVIKTYIEEFPDIVVGLSDHESGIAMALVAYVLGARVIEKHFTLNRAWKGTDHSFSLSKSGLCRMVRNLTRARMAMGDGIKQPIECEIKPISKMSKKLVAARKLEKGHVITKEDIAIKSPGDGMPPYRINEIEGKRLTKSLNVDEPFEVGIVE